MYVSVGRTVVEKEPEKKRQTEIRCDASCCQLLYVSASNNLL